MKKTVCVDFDGVLHSYTSGWQGACVISDPPVPGALDWLTRTTERFTVCIYSSRSKEPGAVDAMRAWLRSHGLAVDVLLRAFCFVGTFPSLDELDAFVPWNKRGAS